MLLADRSAYAPGTLDICGDPSLRRYWLDLFRHHMASASALVAREHADDPAFVEGMQRATEAFIAHVDTIAADATTGPFDTLTLCDARERALRAAGVDDPFRRVKARENAAALALLPAVLAEIDALHEAQRLEALVLGIFAGNVFDLGSHATAALWADGDAEFAVVRSRLAPRPWLVDDLDRFRKRFDAPIHRALLFVDNAGSDIVLGMLPFARECLRRGARVVLSANRTPALNDVTHDELVALVEEAAQRDEALRAAVSSGQLAIVTSGNGLPLIDLRTLGPELRAEIERHPPDLVVLEGMGRAVESNWNARLRVDALKIAMLKDVSVARHLGGSLYDLVCRFEPAG
ncbi:MAG: DUF89 family protein [Deltaproteobacteria bacterium]|nr:DUF89 family protein [Deltaproteobacteria bacterium]